MLGDQSRWWWRTKDVHMYIVVAAESRGVYQRIAIYTKKSHKTQKSYYIWNIPQTANEWHKREPHTWNKNDLWWPSNAHMYVRNAPRWDKSFTTTAPQQKKVKKKQQQREGVHLHRHSRNQAGRQRRDYLSSTILGCVSICAWWTLVLLCWFHALPGYTVLLAAPIDAHLLTHTHLDCPRRTQRSVDSPPAAAKCSVPHCFRATLNKNSGHIFKHDTYSTVIYLNWTHIYTGDTKSSHFALRPSHRTDPHRVGRTHISRFGWANTKAYQATHINRRRCCIFFKCLQCQTLYI